MDYIKRRLNQLRSRLISLHYWKSFTHFSEALHENLTLWETDTETLDQDRKWLQTLRADSHK